MAHHNFEVGVIVRVVKLDTFSHTETPLVGRKVLTMEISA